jgi:hypothetical protein
VVSSFLYCHRVRHGFQAVTEGTKQFTCSNWCNSVIALYRAGLSSAWRFGRCRFKGCAQGSFISLWRQTPKFLFCMLIAECKLIKLIRVSLLTQIYVGASAFDFFFSRYSTSFKQLGILWPNSCPASTTPHASVLHCFFVDNIHSGIKCDRTSNPHSAIQPCSIQPFSYVPGT